MGWCSATEIMDTALQAAEAVATTLLRDSAENGPGSEIPFDPAENKMDRRALDDVLRPFVATIAEHLRNRDWDCIEDSDYFDRFPHEMLGLDDHEWEWWLVEKIKDTDYDVPTRRRWMRTLEAFYQKGEADG